MTRMKKYRITYLMHPYQNIEIVIWARDYEEAVEFERDYRRDGFDIKEEEQHD